MITNSLRFTFGNAKLVHGQAIFDLPAGHSCPFADKCLSRFMPATNKIVDGPNTEFRCYAANQEIWAGTRNLRWGNFNTLRKLKTRKELFNLIESNMPEYHILIRVHSSGDFFNQNYFDAWMDVARKHPDKTFYAYTKAIPFWVKRKKTIPANFRLNASFGGKHDNLIVKHKLKSVKVVLSQGEAKALGLEIDHTDELAFKGTKSFALLIHGTQPANTPASVAWQLVKKTTGGYSREKIVLTGKQDNVTLNIPMNKRKGKNAGNVNTSSLSGVTVGRTAIPV